MFKLLEPFKLLMPNCMHELSYELQKLFLNYEFSGFINQLDGDVSSKFVQISCMPDKIFKQSKGVKQHRARPENFDICFEPC